MSELDDFRKAKDQFFAQEVDSPLAPEQKRDFEGLKYFPENPALSLEVDVAKLPAGDTVEMQTSTGDVQVYQRYCRFQFEVDGQTAELTIYANRQGFFLPFVDSLAGQETYPAGRYLEPAPLEEGRFYVDFNYAYNPYCAYNDMWSCPFPPAENRLKVPIRAGEKIFKSE